MTRISSWLSQPTTLRSLLAQARLAVRLWREPRVPALVKAIPVLAALYVISPIDLVPDMLLGLGQLDDLGIVILAMELFVRLCPTDAAAYHRDAIAQGRRYSPMSVHDDAIEAEWHRG
jgi:uncharacterized membrane protein YkvA (DUF1232 family)